MPNLLTPQDAALFIRSDETDPIMNMLLPQIDAFVFRATGRDWTEDNVINDLAKGAAGMLLVLWYDNPAQVGNENSLPFGLTNILSMLEAEALKYKKFEFYGLTSSGGIGIPFAKIGDQVMKLIGVYGDSGDQSSKFESVVTVMGTLKQTYTGNLFPNRYVVIMKSPGADVLP
jgi:hypothetical protein